MSTLALVNPDGTPAMFGDHGDERVIGPKRIHLMAGADVPEPQLSLNVKSADSARWILDCTLVRGIGCDIYEQRFYAIGGECVSLPGLRAGEGLVMDVTVRLPEHPLGGIVEFRIDAIYKEALEGASPMNPAPIGPEPIAWPTDDEGAPIMSLVEGERWSFGPTARERARGAFGPGGFISTETVRRGDEGGCNGCTAKTETVTLVVLRSIELRLCIECRASLAQMLANEPAPRLVDGRVMRGDVEVEPKCPICGTGIVCPCGVGIGT